MRNEQSASDNENGNFMMMRKETFAEFTTLTAKKLTNPDALFLQQPMRVEEDLGSQPDL